MEFSALQIAELLDGEIKGNPQVTVNAVAKIEEGHKGDLSFLANPAYTKFLYTTEASVVIVNKDFVIEKETDDVYDFDDNGKIYMAKNKGDIIKVYDKEARERWQNRDTVLQDALAGKLLVKAYKRENFELRKYISSMILGYRSEWKKFYMILTRDFEKLSVLLHGMPPAKQLCAMVSKMFGKLLFRLFPPWLLMPFP